MAHAPFVPLRIHSAFSMLEGAIAPKAVGEAARKLGFPAAAVTDRNGLFGAMAFEDGCRSAGVQPIMATLLAVRRPEASRPDWLALYAQDEAGYGNLCRLVSMAHLDRPLDEEAHVPLERLEGHSHGLIALTGGGEGALARLLAEGQRAAAERQLAELHRLFPGRLYVELSRRGDPVEEAAEAALVELADARGLPLVATNPAFYAEPAFHEAHDALLCIAESQVLAAESRRRSSPAGWLKPASQMQELFADLPDALANTLVVAQRCAVGAPRRDPILPSLAGDPDAEAEKLRADATAGLVARLAPRAEVEDEANLRERFPAYFDRLGFEADVIAGMGFAGYFLIVADFIQWAKRQDIPVGPGRGSGAGSLIAWALTITDLDPIEHGLLFERFLNPERVSMPDFDIDFCETRRGEVIRYVEERYGQGRVAQIITFGMLKARAVLRDTGRVLQMNYGHIDRLCKLVPNHPGDPFTLERALGRAKDKEGRPQAGAPEFMAEARSPEVKRLLDLALKLEGLPRHVSTHAAGVVIADRPLAELVPLYRDPRSDLPVTQFDMKWVESAGLVKFDFLGLKTLSVLRKAVDMLADRGVAVELATMRLDDPKVYELLQRGDTVGVFQLESEGMRRTLAAVKPTAFADIVALVSLFRPGPMDNIPSYGRRKNGEEPVSYPHPLLKDILAETQGIFVYQEQVMQAAQVLAGYSLGEADLLRRAMGKKKKEEMDAQRARFIAGCGERNISANKAGELFDLIDKFAGYGFNKSHAAAYAVISYQTAWLKAHHPAVFYAASMCFDQDQSEKLCVFVDDMRRLDVPVLPPSIQASQSEFTVEALPDDRQGVRYGLAGLKNVGERAMELTVAARPAQGFASLDDFAERIDSNQVNRRSLEALAAAGAFDALEPDRARVFAGAETICAAAASAREGRESGQHGLFGGADIEVPALRLPDVPAWGPGERLAREKEAFGFYFSDHPVTHHRAAAVSHGAVSHAELLAQDPIPEGGRRSAAMAALVERLRWRESRRGNRFAQVDLSDASGPFTASCFEESVCATLAELSDRSECALLFVECDRPAGEEGFRIAIRTARRLADLTALTRLSVEVEVAEERAVRLLSDLLRDRGSGRCELRLRTRLPQGNWAAVALGDRFAIDAELAERMRLLPGITSVEVRPAGPPPLRVVR